MSLCAHGSSPGAAASLPRPYSSRSCKGKPNEGNGLPSRPPGREPRALRAAGARRQPPTVRRPGRGHARRGGVRRGAGARRARQRHDGRLRGQLALARPFRGRHGARLAPPRGGRPPAAPPVRRGRRSSRQSRSRPPSRCPARSSPARSTAHSASRQTRSRTPRRTRVSGRRGCPAPSCSPPPAPSCAPAATPAPRCGSPSPSPR